MVLYFLRHGKAEDRRPDLPDFDRRLTPKGVEEMHAAAKGIAALDPELDTLYSSPLPRALETAQITAKALKLPEESLHVDSRLEPGAFTLGTLQAILASRPAAESVMFVGHEPDLSDLAGLLVGGASFGLRKGGLAIVECTRPEPGGGALRSLFTAGDLIGHAGARD